MNTHTFAQLNELLSDLNGEGYNYQIGYIDNNMYNVIMFHGDCGVSGTCTEQSLLHTITHLYLTN